jgi:hypothetical protein
MSDRVLIQYDYPGTTNGKPVGTVYVVEPLFGPESGVYSHTYRVDEASLWSAEGAEREIGRRYWPNARAVRLDEARDLST